MRFESVSRTHVGLKRKINEDSLFADPERGLWAVADGMGGHEAGEVASAMVVDALRCLPAAEDPDALTADAAGAMREVNRQLLELGRSGGHGQTIGTTVVGLAIGGMAVEGGRYSCFWAGDSRAYLLRGGEIRRLSRDHSLVQDLVDAGMLKPEEAENHVNANVVTRAVGAAEDLQLDTVGGDALAGDIFLLASDGLTRLVADDELAAELGRGAMEQVADKLIETVLERGAPDNVSLVIVRVV
jgi:serine/threonine protein phosphatase PrpC